MMDSSAYLGDHLHDGPVLVVPCIEDRVEGASPVVRAVTWSSILPATWSFMVAAPRAGLGRRGPDSTSRTRRRLQKSSARQIAWCS